MTYSTNQFRQLYVASTYKAIGENNRANVSNVGDINVTKAADGKSIYFNYMGAGGQLRSDLIDIDKILYAKATKSAAMARDLKSVVVTMDSSVNSGNPVANQQYFVKIAYKQFVGMSDEDTYYEMGDAFATPNMSASKLLADLAISLAKNVAKQKMVEIHLATTTSTVADTDAGIVNPNGTITLSGSTSAIDPVTNTYTGIEILEIAQPWTRGIKAQTPVDFDVYTPLVYVSGIKTQWANVEEAASGISLGNGKMIADLEYFCMGERGDIYRNVGWPNSIPTTYLVDPAKNYSAIDIHYAYVGANESVQKSEKDITIVVADGDSGSEYTEINKIIAAINAAAGKTILVADKDTALVDTSTGKPIADVTANVNGDTVNSLS